MSLGFFNIYIWSYIYIFQKKHMKKHGASQLHHDRVESREGTCNRSQEHKTHSQRKLLLRAKRISAGESPYQKEVPL